MKRGKKPTLTEAKASLPDPRQPAHSWRPAKPQLCAARPQDGITATTGSGLGSFRDDRPAAETGIPL